MPEVTSSRARVLAGIRMSLGEAIGPAGIEEEYSAIARNYVQASDADVQQLIELFTHRLVEYDAGVYRTTSIGISKTISQILKAREKHAMAIPSGLSSAWMPDGFDFEVADTWSNDQLDRIDGTLSGCTVAIAETGTIVLQKLPSQGPRILSLVPDYHLCVVFEEQLVATVPEAFARLSSNLPTTFISGPSATADIEMTRIKGVHGPRFLDVVVVS